MKPSEFDELLRSGFGQHEFAFNPDNWARMNSRLEQKPAATAAAARPRRWPLIGGMAAAAAVLIACALFLLPGAAPEAADVTAFQPVSERTLALPAAEETSPAPALLSASARSSRMLRSSLKPGSTPVPAPAEEKPFAEVPAPQQQGPVVAGNPEKDRTPAVPAKKQVQRIDLSQMNAYEDDDDPRPKNNASFSLGGGVNYGSLNTGYAVALNARKSLNRRLYVEGDLGVVSNNSSYSSSVTSGQLRTLQANASNADKGGGDYAGLAASAEAAGVERHDENFYYLQFAPTVGYQLSRRLSIGAGPDFQQLLQGGGEKTVVTSSDYRSVEVVPDFDFGVQGKTEYAVSSRLKAGLQYREGLNNMFHKGDKLVNRRYMQVHLKYRLFGQ